MSPTDERARFIGDTVILHGSRQQDEARRRAGKRRVEVVVNGNVVASQDVPADDKIHSLSFRVKIDRSSWVAIRHFPQLHTNPVTVSIEGKPIRASRLSALWCISCIEQLWRVRGKTIAESERAEAQKTFEKAMNSIGSCAEAAEGVEFRVNRSERSSQPLICGHAAAGTAFAHFLACSFLSSPRRSIHDNV